MVWENAAWWDGGGSYHKPLIFSLSILAHLMVSGGMGSRGRKWFSQSHLCELWDFDPGHLRSSTLNVKKKKISLFWGHYIYRTQKEELVSFPSVLSRKTVARVWHSHNSYKQILLRTLNAKPWMKWGLFYHNIKQIAEPANWPWNCHRGAQVSINCQHKVSQLHAEGRRPDVTNKQPYWETKPYRHCKD